MLHCACGNKFQWLVARTDFHRIMCLFKRRLSAHAKIKSPFQTVKCRRLANEVILKAGQNKISLHLDCLLQCAMVCPRESGDWGTLWKWCLFCSSPFCISLFLCMEIRILRQEEKTALCWVSSWVIDIVWVCCDRRGNWGRHLGMEDLSLVA